MKIVSIVLISLMHISLIMGQDKNEKSHSPFYQITDYPTDYSAENVLIRMIDGLGYRYYWATKDLKEKDLNYDPGNESMLVRQVLHHLYNLSKTIDLSLNNKKIQFSRDEGQSMPWTDKRLATLQNLENARSALLNESFDINKTQITFARGERTSSFPIWNLINGPIADAIYHVGQIVSYRRSSGNPMHSGVNVFIGKTKE